MRPAPFEYVRPASLDEALAALGADNASVLAGGQVLLNRLRARVERPAVVVDVSRLDGLAAVSEDAGTLAIGALATLAELDTDTVRAACPALAQAIGLVGDPQVRNRATIGGNVLNPDPVSDVAAVLLATAGSLVFRTAAGERTVPAHEFFVRPAARPEPGELLTELRFGRAGAASAYVKLTRRAADAAMAGAAAVVRLDGDTLTEVGLAFSAVHDHPVRAHTVERELTGAPFDPATARAAVERFAAGLRPVDTAHADADYKRRMAAVVAVRALEQAITGTTGTEGTPR